jgi:hypothetical protein
VRSRKVLLDRGALETEKLFAADPGERRERRIDATLAQAACQVEELGRCTRDELWTPLDQKL